MTRAQLIDQVQGLAYGVVIAVAVAVLPILREAEPDAFWTTAFWVGLAATAARSAGTAVLTVLGIRIPGISGGK